MVRRPDDLAEAERIAAEGGEVRRLRPGSGTSRIFAPGRFLRWEMEGWLGDGGMVDVWEVGVGCLSHVFCGEFFLG